MLANFHIINLGCKVNRVESDRVTARLLASGATQSTPSSARVVLINTCTVTAEADTKSRKIARRALREAPSATVIVMGCGAQANPAQFEQEEPRLELIANKERALERACELLELDLISAEDPSGQVRVGDDFNTRVAIKVQDGCDHACSYCIVPRARGAARSEPTRRVLQEISTQVQAGARELVLTGIDLGSYRSEEADLASLLKDALACSEGFRLRLSSIEFHNLSDELIELIAASEGRICAHLHVPLQSGSDAVLEAMKRRYSSKEYLRRIHLVRETLPSLALTTDVIVGFPGETDQDFEATLEVCRQASFARIHQFRYSKRPGTPAAEMEGSLSPECVSERAEKLRVLAEQLEEKDAISRIGTSEQILFETSERGRSESYYPVSTVKPTERGKLVTMNIIGFEQGRLIAE